jgi:transcriptional regulator with XRE-family HTH domain
MDGNDIPGPGDLGRRIAARRQRLGWSRAQLAAKTGLSLSYVTFIETHPAVVTMACLVRLADGLGTTVEALLGAGRADQDGAALAGLWAAEVRTGLPGERPLPSLG